MRQNDADIIFAYLKSILFERNASMLSDQDVSTEFSKVVQGMNLLHNWLNELSGFAEDIALGNLNGKMPERANPLCDSLKMLRSNFSHLVWQTQQVANGDYSQKVAMMGEFTDAFNIMIEQLKQRELALREQNALLSCITDNIGEYVIVFDEETKEVLYENKALIDTTIKEPELIDILHQYLEETNADTSIRSRDISFISPSLTDRMLHYHLNSFFIDWQGRKSIAYLLRDVTDQKEWESSIEYAANSDPLTGLFNRRYCMEILEGYVRDKEDFSVCFADLDKLKYVNDNFGHACGDEYILTTTSVLRDHFRKEDIICRIGGDEFVILMQGCSSKYMEMRMKQVRSRLAQLALKGEHNFSMSISYGIYASNENEGLSADEILEKSDERMYAFKQAHRR